MRRCLRILFAVSWSLAGSPLVAAEPVWRELVPGASYAAIPFIADAQTGDGVLHVVRIDAATAQVVALAASAKTAGAQTAQSWCRENGLAVAINAGMYATDHSTHTGYFRLDGHINSRAWLREYKSVFALQPKVATLPPAQLIDRESADDFADTDYSVVIQNLRLIKAPATNVWTRSDRAWSEAALAADREGRLLFLFMRTPSTMPAFNAALLASDLHVVRAMHLEGGPEASLSIHVAGLDLDLAGSYETGFTENDSNSRQWPIPNVIGVRAP
jgi:Phosphodiester glycosidase